MLQKSINILLIEDNPGDALLIQNMLAEDQHMATVFEQVACLSAGIERIARGNVDVVLLDMGLPDSTGIDTLRRLINCSQQVPAIVVMSGLGDEEVAVQAVHEGAQDYLVKGHADADMLVRSVRYAIERNKTEEALRKARDELEARVRERTSSLQIEIEERKHVQEALRLAGAYNRSLIEASLDPLVTIGRDGKITDVNAATEAATGYSRTKLIGTDFSEYFTDPEKARCGYQQVFREGFVRDYDLELRHCDGHVTSVLYNATIYRDDNGNVIGVFAAARDITERKRAEYALQKYAEALDDLYNSAPCGYHSLDTEGIFVRINDTELNMLGYTRDEIIGKKTFPDLITKESLHTFQNNFSIFKDRGWINDLEFEMIRKDGSTLPVLLQATAVKDSSGNYIMSRSTIIDITERKKAEELLRKAHNELEIRVQQRTAELSEVVAVLESEIADRKYAEETLRQSEERFRMLISAVQDYAIIMLAPDGTVMSWNSGAERIYRYSSKEIIGQSISRFYTSEDLDAGKLVQALEDALKHGTHQNEGWRIRKDGSRFWANVQIATITDDKERLRGFAKVTRDLTERRQAEEVMRSLAGRLLTAQEVERSRIARELHDDVTQRIAVLAIEMGKLEQETDSSGTLSHRMRDLKDNLIKLSQDVHSLSRQLHPSIVEDLGLIDALHSECTNFSQREKISIRYSPQTFPAEIPKEIALCLYRIAQEGLRNIAKHAKVKEACVSLTSTNDGVFLSIEDSGVGFNPAQIRGKPGLGLSSMEERVRLIGGEFSIHTEPGKGTLIEVWAPLQRSVP